MPTTPNYDSNSDEHEVSIVQSKYGRLLPIVFNIMILAEVCVAMYFAAKQPEKLTEIFLSIFLTAFVITIISAWIVKYFLNSHQKGKL